MTVSQLHREIHEQPAVLRRLLVEGAEPARRIAEAIQRRAPKYVTLVARGSSDNAARYMQYLLAINNGMTAGLAIPSAYTLYGRPPVMTDSLVIGISQSGQSPDIVAVMQEARRQGALTVALTNIPGSPLEAAAELHLPLLAGVETAVAATKTYTASLLGLALISTALNGDPALWEALQRLPDWAAAIADHAEGTIRAAERYTYMEYCVVASRGFNYATAFEVALKLKELTYIIAEPYSSADFLHGPMAVVEHGFPVFAIVPEGTIAPELVTFLSALNERGASLIVVSADPAALQLAQTPLFVPAGIPEWLSPIPLVIQGQLFALGLTLAKRLDPDAPRGLRKVTLTR
ncbi:MAG: SIS domain-containing protein [Candidatus Flexifilum sp.]